MQAGTIPSRRSLFLPGARLPILPSAALVQRGVRLCLLALSIANEDRVIARNADSIAAAGRFQSIFAASSHSVRGLFA